MKKNIDIIIGVALTLIVSVFYLADFSALKILELKTYDWRAQLKTDDPPGEVVIVAIDNESISRIGRWPWPRSVAAELLEKLNAAGPRVIGLNVLFSEQERNPGLAEIKELKNRLGAEAGQRPAERSYAKKIVAELESLEARLDNDTKLSATVASLDNLVLPMYFTLSAGGPLPPEDILAKIASSGVDFPGNMMPEASGLTAPIGQFLAPKALVGHVNIYPDADGVVRAEMPFIDFQGKLYPSFALATALKYLNLMPDALFLTPSELKIGKRGSLLFDERGFMLLSYYGGYKTFPYYSAHEIIEDKISPETFRDKIVLVGNTATGVADFNVTPLAPAVPGIEIIATTIENALHFRFVRRPDWAFVAELAAILLIGVYISIVLPKMRAKFAAIVSGGAFALFLVAGIYFFAAQSLWLKISYPLFLIASGYLLITSKKFLITERRKELVEADSIETNKMLGLSFQGQGMLDMAFEKFRKCPLDDAMKDLLYNLALDFERKRQYNKAMSVLGHIEKIDPKFKDIAEKIKNLRDASEGKVGAGGLGKKPDAGGTVIVEGASQTPTLGRYEVSKELGKGAMGIVYLGKDPKINRTVAIKTLQFDSDLDEAQLKMVKERFFREAESAGMLNHPNIITIYDAGEDYDISYIAMELLDGDDLKKNCDKQNLLPARRVVDIVAKVANALEYAHKQGIVHRDIKPSNIMILKDGTVKVTDFGIARITSSSKTATGTVLGTPSYMSPEQIAGKKADGRADIFSLGVTLYELLTGVKPFEGESIAQLLFQITQAKHPDPKQYNPAITDALRDILDKALEKDPEKRYQNAGEMEKDLLAALEGLPI
ncbi:MAG: serine/threonine-protein kinase [Endomicrobiia bacterium]|nr:serine/threonine-protein kinase [Endomicrobiia bacterium]